MSAYVVVDGTGKIVDGALYPLRSIAVGKAVGKMIAAGGPDQLKVMKLKAGFAPVDRVRLARDADGRFQIEEVKAEAAADPEALDAFIEAAMPAKPAVPPEECDA